MAARILVVDDSPTLRKVVTGILERHGYETLSAPDGQVALDALKQDDARVDLVLVDFVMPRMNGFQFCRAVRQSERWATLPVVLMSAKSDKIRDQFVQQTGALDAISKPFDAQALVVAIENALRRMNQGRGSQARLPDVDDLEAVSSSTASNGSLRGLDEAQQQLRVAAQVAPKAAGVLAPLLARIDGAASDRAQLERALSSSWEQLRDLAQSLRGIEQVEGKVALAGDIAVIPIGAVLQMLQVESQTGLVVVSNGKSEVTIAMRAGLIDLVQSRGAGDEFRLGRFFVEEGLVTPQEIDALLQEVARGRTPSTGTRAVDAPPAESGEADRSDDARPSQPPPSIPPGPPTRMLLGDALVQSGRVTDEQLKSALARQSSELVYEVLRWPKGRFELRAQPAPPLAQKAQLGLPVASVVMEGFRRVDEWRLVEVGLGSFESVLVRDAMALDALPPRPEGGGLSRQERVVLEAIDGVRTVREIIAESHMSSFDACRILMQFLEARLVRRRQG